MIYHITSRDAWAAAQSEGKYHAESLASQGFIHFSQARQVARVANAVYVGQTDLVLLHVDPVKLTAEIRIEPPDPTIPAHHYDGELFPHLYGALNLDAVVFVEDFVANEEGVFDFM